MHPRVFAETKRWPPYKKKKYQDELALLTKIKSTPGLRPPTKKETDSLDAIIIATMDELGSPIGSADREQLCSAIYSKSEIVTNDTPFARVAEALDVSVHSAEKIVIEAHSQGVINKDEVKSARNKWLKNSEKPASPEEEKALNEICN